MDSSRNETGVGYWEGEGVGPLLFDTAVWPDSFARPATANCFVTVAKFKFRLIMSYLSFVFPTPSLEAQNEFVRADRVRDSNL